MRKFYIDWQDSLKQNKDDEFYYIASWDNWVLRLKKAWPSDTESAILNQMKKYLSELPRDGCVCGGGPGCKK